HLDQNAPQRRLAEPPPTAPDLSRCIPDSPPRSHLLRRSGGSPAGRNAADTASPRCVGPPAARRRYQDRVLSRAGPNPLLRTLLPLVGRGVSKGATLRGSRTAAGPVMCTRGA